MQILHLFGFNVRWRCHQHNARTDNSNSFDCREPFRSQTVSSIFGVDFSPTQCTANESRRWRRHWWRRWPEEKRQCNNGRIQLFQHSKILIGHIWQCCSAIYVGTRSGNLCKRFCACAFHSVLRLLCSLVCACNRSLTLFGKQWGPFRQFGEKQWMHEIRTSWPSPFRFCTVTMRTMNVCSVHTFWKWNGVRASHFSKFNIWNSSQSAHTTTFPLAESISPHLHDTGTSHQFQSAFCIHIYLLLYALRSCTTCAY